MKVRVRIFGTLSQYYPDYRSDKGMEIEVPDGATSADLLAHLDISITQMAVVFMDGRILKSDHKLRDGSSLSIFQAVFGG
jgi:sulfur carrier protein ThiS